VNNPYSTRLSKNGVWSLTLSNMALQAEREEDRKEETECRVTAQNV
jgi:hypothetical protein